MASENEPAKVLLPYLQRADELYKHEPLVAYYCRLYAMEKGLKFPQKERTDTTNKILVSLIKQLEKDKKSLSLSPDDHLHLEGFALNVFMKADKQDRAGRADINTAKTFYAASIFFDVLNQFGELPPDLEQKQKYALWKAADIRKAIKEGRTPVPGPPGGEQDLPSPSATSSGGYDFERKHTGFDINPTQEPDLTPSPQFPDGLGRQASINIPPPSPPSYPNGDYSSHSSEYPSHDYQSGHNSGRPENPTFPQPYQDQTYHQEPQEPQIPQYYHPQDAPQPYTLPNFQSYPSFSESSLPATPSHFQSQYQGSDASYSQQSVPTVTNYASPPQYNSTIGNGSVQEAAPTIAKTYHYDSTYQPQPEKIAEAQKAARFAVGALAFDEVPVAVEHLRKALEYLTNPSAGH